jgi:uncharacterized protein (DUF169 family)
MNENRELASQLQQALNLPVSPIAISVVDKVPDGVPEYNGTAPAGCLFWQEAAKGAFATSTKDHELCAIGVHTHNLAAPSPAHERELTQVLGVMAGMNYVREEDVAAIPVIQKEVKHVIYAPLADSPVPPDVVMLFAHSRQSLVITEAVAQVDDSMPPAMGRPACAAIPQALNSGRAAMSLGCCGARAYLDELTDDIALWALPGTRLQAYTETISTFAGANDVLTNFHTLRRKDVDQGKKPTIAESLSRLQN